VSRKLAPRDVRSPAGRADAKKPRKAAQARAHRPDDAQCVGGLLSPASLHLLAGPRRRQENETWRSVLERSALAEVRSRSVLEAHVREGSYGAAPGLVRPA